MTSVHCGIPALLLLSIAPLICSEEHPESTSSPHVISLFFVTPASPAQFDIAHHKNLKNIIKTPGAADRALLRSYATMPLVSGIPCLYLGTLTYSDLNGQLILPRVQEADEIILIISERISPVIRHGNSVDHWIIREKNQAVRYLLKRIQEENNQPYWTITQQILDVTIPNAALVLLAPPHALQLPTTRQATYPGPHLILPDITIVDKIPLQTAALNTIALNRFWEPAPYWTVYALDRYALIPG